MTLLSENEITNYHLNGLIVPNIRLDSNTVETLQNAYEELLHKNPNIEQNVIICPHLSSYGPVPLNGNPIWLELAYRSEILNMVEQVMGSDIILWGTTIFGKPAGSGQVVPWHQDAPHWPIKPAATTSVWIALDHCTAENGCLRFIPESHNGTANHIDINKAPLGQDAAVRLILEQDSVDESKAQNVLLEPGQMSIHDTWLIHGSNPNRSEHRRVAFVLRFMPGTSYFNHKHGNAAARRAGAITDYKDRPLYLLRGTNKGCSDLSKGHYS